VDRVHFNVSQKTMNYISLKILEIFPEIKLDILEGDEELTYVMMGHVCHYVKNTYDKSSTGSLEQRDLLSRIITLRDWSEDQDDESEAYTVYIVGFYETICETKKTHDLIPFITQRTDFINSKEYLQTWIGSENYDQILKKWTK